MSALRIIAPIVTTTALGVAYLAATAPPAVSSPDTSSTAASSAGAAVDQCRLRIMKVRVKDLQHDADGIDNAFVKIGNSVTATRSYVIPQTRNTLSDGEEEFVGTARVALRVEILGGASSVRVGSDTVPCLNTTRDFVFDNGDAKYKVKALVQVLP
jgi:hypothetical protein